MKLNKVYNLDCLEGLKLLEDNSIDSIVTDPPYELGFMGKSWDKTGIAYNVELWRECLRVLKPGGHLLAFGGTRTYHRMVCAIEDAGFEIRDQIQWIYGSGFPKGQNISKGIDKKFGTEREVVEAKPWEGWNTALKPANEPIVIARKPLSERTIIDNVLKWGTGGINIDACRIGTIGARNNGRKKDSDIYGKLGTFEKVEYDKGRYPTNTIFDEESSQILDEQTGTLKSGKNAIRRKEGFFLEHGGLGKEGDVQITYGDSGGASRFFYCAKASKKEKGKNNNHPTVKPLKLMQYLVRLVTPKGGTVLDPFAGSGTALVAAQNEGMNYIGMEKETQYIDIIDDRLSKYSK